MLRQLAVLTVLVLWPALASARSFTCTLKQGPGDQRKQIWSGKLDLDDKGAAAGKILILKNDGHAIGLDEIVALNDGKVPIETTLEPYDGLLVFGLRRSGRNLDLNIGHVDVRNTKNSAPMDVDSWATVDTKEIGVLYSRIGVWLLCKS